ncbi:MAG: hypothetical protein JNM34_04625 [Chthonomonadaceae bacterium]|nr:hypothetical protein [Chthonomonadaceae bacterium]
MFLAIVTGLLHAQGSPSKISLQDSSWMVEGARGVETVSLGPKKSSPTGWDAKKGTLSFVLGGKKFLYDGKAVRITLPSKKVVSTNFKSVPVSGKVSTQESNAELMDLVSKKVRRLEFSGIGGWVTVEKSLYLLLRWTDVKGHTWLETAVKFDMAQPVPQPSLINKFEGNSFAEGKIDQVLALRGPNLTVMANKDGRFGLSRISIKDGASNFEPFGEAVGKAKWMGAGETAWTLTPTSYGTNRMGVADFDQNDYHVVAEFRGKMTSVSAPGYASYQVGKKSNILNLLTGATLGVKDGFQLRHTVNGVLVWYGSAAPSEASLYDGSFRRIANWSRPPAKSDSVVLKTVPPPVKTKKSIKPTPTKKGAVNNGAPAAKVKKPSKPSKPKPKTGKGIKIDISAAPAKRGAKR